MYGRTMRHERRKGVAVLGCGGQECESNDNIIADNVKCINIIIYHSFRR